MSLTPGEKQFLIDLKNRGVNQQEATQRLMNARAALQKQSQPGIVKKEQIKEISTQPAPMGPFLPAQTARSRGIGPSAVAPGPAREEMVEEQIEMKSPVSPFGTNIGRIMEKEKIEEKMEPLRQEEQPIDRTAQFGTSIGPIVKRRKEKGPLPSEEFIEKLPTTVARTVSQPFEFLRDVSATAGQKLGQVVPEKFKISRESTLGKILSVMTPEGSEPVLGEVLKPIDPISSSREFAGRGIEALANAGLIAMPAGKIAGFAPGAALKSRLATSGGLGFLFGTGGALQDEENVKTARDVITQGILAGVVAATVPELPRLFKKVGQKTMSTGIEALNRFTNKRTGEALQTIKNTPIDVIRKYGKSTKPFQLRKQTFDPLYKTALEGSKGKVSSKTVLNNPIIKELIDVEPEGAIGRFAKQIQEKSDDWTLQELQKLQKKIGAKIPKSAATWTHEQSLANQTVKQIKNIIGKMSPQYARINRDYGLATRFITANELINKSGSGVVGTSLAGVMGYGAGGPVGVAASLALKSAKNQRALMVGIKKLANAKSAQQVNKIIAEISKSSGPEIANALLRISALLSVREE